MNHRHIIAPASLLFFFVLLIGCSPKEKTTPDVEVQTRPVKTMTIGVFHNDELHQYPAKVRATQRVKLAFQVSGKLINLPIKAGDYVKKDQVIAALDSRDFENTMKSAEARYQESKTTFERHDKLLKSASVSVSVFESKRMAHEVAEAEFKIAKKAFEDTTLKAPFDGIVAGTYVDNFQSVKAHDAVIGLQDISHVEVLINVPEKDVIRSTFGATLDDVNNKVEFKVIFPALGNRAFELKLKEFETEADPNTQTFKAVMTMPAPKDLNIMPGMTAIVTVSGIDSLEKRNTCWAPVSAIVEDSDGKRHVWLLDKEMKAHKQPVDIGIANGDRILIKHGLSAGDKIAITGASLISEGMKVKELRRIDGRDVCL